MYIDVQVFVWPHIFIFLGEVPKSRISRLAVALHQVDVKIYNKLSSCLKNSNCSIFPPGIYENFDCFTSAVVIINCFNSGYFIDYI